MAVLEDIALALVPGIGGVRMRRLLKEIGTAHEVFGASRSQLSQFVPPVSVTAILSKSTFSRAGEELEFTNKNGVTAMVPGDANYPVRLRHCADAPSMLFYKGTAGLNPARVLSVVGTRAATAYGQEVAGRLVEDLKSFGVLVVSGLAQGIDGLAHRACVQYGLPTVGVLGHGLDRVYPARHRELAEKMLEQGGLLTEFPSYTLPGPDNFPRRNRIIAGMSDATIVIEAGIKGGALITADLANSYDREVMAFPGSVTQEFSAGCNHLISRNCAHLVTSAADVAALLGWEAVSSPGTSGTDLLAGWTGDELQVVSFLSEKGAMMIDDLGRVADLPQNKLAAVLLSLEMAGALKMLPGKICSLVRK